MANGGPCTHARNPSDMEIARVWGRLVATLPSDWLRRYILPSCGLWRIGHHPTTLFLFGVLCRHVVKMPLRLES
jgi:hypothetical protein